MITMAKQIVSVRTMSRRSFLKSAAVLGLGIIGTGSLAGCAPDAGGSTTTAAADGAKTVKVLTYNGNPPYCSQPSTSAANCAVMVSQPVPTSVAPRFST